MGRVWQLPKIVVYLSCSAGARNTLGPINDFSYMGIWWRRLLLCAPLVRPAIVGWSGILPKSISKWFLNIAVSPWSLFLREIGRELNRVTPLTAKDPSIAFLRNAGVLGIEVDLGHNWKYTKIYILSPYIMTPIYEDLEKHIVLTWQWFFSPAQSRKSWAKDTQAPL